MQTKTDTVDIAFPQALQSSPSSNLPMLVETPAAKGLELIVKDSTPAQAAKTLSCSSLLQGDTLVRAEADADKLFTDMRANSQVFMTYGTQALTGVNGLVTRLLHDVDATKIPELTGLMRDLNDGMREVKNKYDVSDPKVREKFAEWKGGFSRFFGKAKTLIEMLMEDVTSIEGQLEKVGNTLLDRQHQLTRNVGYYDEMYVENEAEILKVIYAIGVMELIRDKAANAAAAIVVGDAQLGDRGGEKKAELAEFATNMDIKIAEYKGRLFVAWSTSPQVRTMRTLNVSLAERINELLNVTIPTMRATIVQWRMLIQTEDAGKLSAAVQEASNEWLQAYAAAGAQVVPRVAELVQTPTLTPETIGLMAQSVATQAEGIIRAMELGNQRRAEMDTAILEAKTVLDDSSKMVSDAVVANIVASATKPLEIATSVTSNS